MCCEDKATSEYYKRKTGSLMAECKKCTIARSKKYKIKKFSENTHLTCSKCKVLKPISDYKINNCKCVICTEEDRILNYQKNSERRRKYRQNNKEKIREGHKRHYDENRQKILDYAKWYRENNADKVSAVKKKWVEQNKKKNNATALQCRKKQREKDSSLVIGELLRSRFYQAIFNSKGNGKKYKSVISILGMTVSEFMNYLTSLFEDGMTLENRSKHTWVIDHIIPVRAFDLQKLEAQEECWHYSNMQPLWTCDNLNKKDHILPSSLEKFQELKDRGLIRKDFELKILPPKSVGIIDGLS